MKLGDILKKVGTSIVKNVVPGGGLIIDMVNEFLPGDKKLPNGATGEQIEQAIQALPPEQQAMVMMKEFDVQIAEVNAWAQVQGYLADADKSGASTRPQISLMMAKVTAFVIVAYATSLTIAVLTDKVQMIKQISDTWPLMLAIIGTPAALLRSYFGMRTKEKEDRYHVATGQPAKTGFLESLVGLVRR